MKLDKYTQVSYFEILSPRWHDRKVLLKATKVGTHNKVVFTGHDGASMGDAADDLSNQAWKIEGMDRGTERKRRVTKKMTKLSEILVKVQAQKTQNGLGATTSQVRYEAEQAINKLINEARIDEVNRLPYWGTPYDTDVFGYETLFRDNRIMTLRKDEDDLHNHK